MSGPTGQRENDVATGTHAFDRHNGLVVGQHVVTVVGRSSRPPRHLDIAQIGIGIQSCLEQFAPHEGDVLIGLSNLALHGRPQPRIIGSRVAVAG